MVIFHGKNEYVERKIKPTDTTEWTLNHTTRLLPKSHKCASRVHNGSLYLKNNHTNVIENKPYECYSKLTIRILLENNHTNVIEN
jgi:hypothetical protein